METFRNKNHRLLVTWKGKCTGPSNHPRKPLSSRPRKHALTSPTSHRESSTHDLFSVPNMCPWALEAKALVPQLHKQFEDPGHCTNADFRTEYWVLQVEMGLRFLDSNSWKNWINLLRTVWSHLEIKISFCCYQRSEFTSLRSSSSAKDSTRACETRPDLPLKSLSWYPMRQRMASATSTSLSPPHLLALLSAWRNASV